MFFHKQLPEQVPGITASKFRILTDGDCIPEANPSFEWYRDPAEYWWNGWLVSLPEAMGLACSEPYNAGSLIGAPWCLGSILMNLLTALADC